MRTRLIALTLGLLVCTATSDLAHHSFSAVYDAIKPVAVTGGVTRGDWEAPLSWFFVGGADGQGTGTKGGGAITPGTRAIAGMTWSKKAVWAVSLG